MVDKSIVERIVPEALIESKAIEKQLRLLKFNVTNNDNKNNNSLCNLLLRLK